MNKIKQAVKRVVPNKVINNINQVRVSAKSLGLFEHDKKQFKKHYSKKRKNINNTQADAQLIFFAHSIEKGLSHNDIRLGFGKNALTGLSNYFKIYKQNNFNKSNKAYVNALSVMNEYIKIHEQNNYNLDYLKDFFDTETLKEIRDQTSQIGGSVSKSKESTVTNQNFESLFNNRSSIREYSNEKLDLDKINKAIEISMKSPSVCNRQSSRVHLITNHDMIQKVLSVQAGMTGYKTPPALIITTSDLNCFISPTERNQPFIDGGIFSMSLLLALEYEGFASCPLNAMFDKKRELKIKDIANINDNENIIMIISLGMPKNKNKIPKSFRYRAEDITSYEK